MATSVHCSSRTSCTAESPASGKLGAVNVNVTVSGKKSASSSGDLFTYT
jgi:hypothetical protein